ncbi:hypothetical protein JYB64_12460 [Algoriphagus aestuarii]|nr:hypothetical protein [Algoriphagus aestuarii]
MRKYILGCFLVLSFFAKAQNTEKKLEAVPDIHFRMFWMSTTYPNDFKNDFALGSSLNLGTKLTYAEKFQLHVGYRFYANLWSSELTVPDPLTGLYNRYEVGLFDLLNPEDKFFGKLETLSLSYSNAKWGAKIGRMGINSDWINAQDGRLAPTAVEGVHTWYSPNSNWEIGLWGINRFGVRGTSKWLGIGESIGVFPEGRDTNGNPSQYVGNTKSNWISILEVTYTIADFWKFGFSETLVNNISNTLWGKVEKTWKKSNQGKFTGGLQVGFQHGIGEGGNPNQIMRYKNPDDKNWILSGRLGYSRIKWNANLSYSHLGGKGRWLSPREWGKDAWYTFIPRERNEGYEKMDALVLYGEYQLGKSGIKPYLQIGFHWLPDISDPQANKYAFASYRQVNLGVKYQPKELKSWDFHLLVMNKEALGAVELTPKQRYNKLEMIHVNVIANWKPFQ